MFGSPKIRFFTRQGCPLCDEAFVALASIAEQLGIRIELVDIDLDLALLDVYNERVPVVEYQGHVVAEGAIDTDTLKQDIESLRHR